MIKYRMVNAQTGEVQTMDEVVSRTAHGWVCLFEIGPAEHRPHKMLAHPAMRVRPGCAYFDTDLGELIFWIPKPPPGSGLDGTWVDANGEPV